MRFSAILLTGLLMLFGVSESNAQCTPCGSPVTFTVDLTAQPDTVWTLDNVSRGGHCCGATGSTQCIRFDVTIHPQANEVSFNVLNPSPPGGAFYQVDCGPPTSLGTPLCVTGSTSFCIVFCKSGNDQPTYTITSSKTFAASPDITVNNNCAAEMFVDGLDPSTVNWTSVNPGANGDYDGGLSCTSGCDTTYYTPSAGDPSFIDFQVTGTPTGCASGTSADTVRVYIVDAPVVDITPNPAAICAGQSTVDLTVNATGGAPPYSYVWSTGDTTQTITVGTIGTYWVEVYDTTQNCPPSTDTVEVIEHTAVVTADAGADQTVCSDAPTVTLNGFVDQAQGGVWSNGSGTFTPNDSTLNADYTPSAGEISAGQVDLILTTYGNGGCTGDADTMTIFIQQAPVVDAGADQTICEGSTASLAGTVTGGAGTGIWTTSGSGTFSPSDTDLNATYTPSAADETAGTVTLTLTATNACSNVSDQMVITIDPAPVVDAGADQSVCANNPDVALSGSVTVGGSAGIWTTSGSGTFSPSDTDLNATYTPSAADITAGTVTLTLTSTDGCAAVSDDMIVTITPAPVVDAGADQTVCQGDVVSLSGSVTGPTTTGTWSTSGSGSFSPSANDLNATYTPSAADEGAGTVTLTLTSTNNGTCNPVTDDMVVTITLAPVVDAGADQSVCANNADATLNGSVTVGGSQGIWTTSGSGTFSPTDTDLNATYSPSSADTAAGSVTLTLTATDGCSPVSDNMVITYTPAPYVDAGADQIICQGDNASLSGSVSGGSTTGQWTTSGSGTFSPSDTDLNADYVPSAADISAGSVTLTLTSTANGNCNPESDQVVITIEPLPIVDAGADQTLCSSAGQASLSGSVTGGGSAGIWTTSGSGTFSPSDTDLNADYVFSAADISAGSVTLTLTSTDGCAAVSDDMVITIEPGPLADAGADQTICAGDNVTLNGTVSGITTTGQWSTSGSGTFSPSNTDLGATYTPSAADISAGSVTITLTTTNNGSCPPDTDDMIITITPAPVVDAGADQTVCANNADVALSGSVSGASTTGQWSTSGSGTFSPSNTDLNATYTPSSADTTAGTVTLTLTSTNNGGCSAVSDDMVVTITDAPVVDAGADQTICSNNPDAALSGSVSGGSSTGIWTTSGSGTFSPSDTDLNATYTASAADTAAGTVTLTLTSTNNGTCNPESDQMVITFSPSPIVSAGPDQIICTGDDAVLAGSVTGGSSTGTWTTSGSGTFSPSANDLNATYTPSAADITAGSVTLTLTSTNNGNCLPESDDVVITIEELPVVDAGSDQTLCSSVGQAALNGSVTAGGSQGQWSTSGSGTFSPSNTDLNADYVFSAADISAGSVTLTLSSTDGCAVVTDDMVITIEPGPLADAGPNDTICVGGTTTLNGSVTGTTTTGQWSTSGSGTFTPSNTDLNATYTPSAADETAGSVDLILTSTNNGACPASVDTMILVILQPATVDAGANDTVCANNADVFLSGTVSGATTTGQWSTAGSGTFSPSNTDLSATYTPSATDISNGSVTLTLTSTNNGPCSPQTDDMTVTFTSSPVVDAGADQSVCANNAVANLSGSVTGGASTGVWTTSGTGSFSPSATDLNASYTPSSADTANSSVTLTLTSTNNGNCLPESDQMTITYTPAPYVDAGADQTVCANDADVALSGVVAQGASTGQWTTSGSGTFNPSDTDLNATYVPSAADTTAGTVTLVLTSTNNGNCLAVSDTMVITITDAPVVDAGPDQTMCANNTINLSGSVSGPTSTGQWTTSGSGTFDPSDTDLNATYIPSGADTTAGSVVITLTSTNNGSCLAVSDDMTITFTPAPVVDAGPDMTICANDPNAALSGSVSGGSTTGQWTTSGSGTFNPSDTDLNATYTASDADTTAGTVWLYLVSTNNGTCLVVEDSLELTIDPAPVVDAGSDDFVCDGDTYTLSGSVINGGATGQWSTTGSGTFSPSDTDLNATYNPSAADYTAGSVQLILTSTNNGNCLAEDDTITLTFTQPPVVDAGSDQTICSNEDAQLNGSVTGASTTGQWFTSGTGTFNPSDTSLNATYTPSAADITAGSVTLTLESTNACLATDDMVLTIVPGPTVDAGPDQTICASETVVNLSGSVSGSTTTGIWTSTGSGTFSPSDTDLNADYNITQADSSAGTWEIILTSTNSGSCPDESDSMVVTMTTVPVVDAGPDTTACANNPIAITGSISGGSGEALWTTSGSGTFAPDDTSLTVDYLFSPADTAAGSVTLTLADTGACVLITDDMVLTITDAPVVDAGADQTICAGTDATLSGVVSGGASTGQWSTSGTGTFSPSNTDLNATYTPSAGDESAGSVEIILESTNNGQCLPEADTLVLTITPPPFVDAGTDTVLCAIDSLDLNGSVTGATTTGQWSTSGSGTFDPSDTDLNATYIPSSADTAAGSVILTLASTNNGGCIPEDDSINVQFEALPIINAGPDVTVCANNDSIALSGSVIGSTTTGLWVTSGDGTFAPNDSTLNATYIPGSGDESNGSVQLLLFATNLSSCAPDPDTVDVTITPAPVVDAGSDISVCTSNLVVTLNGSVTGGASTGAWITNGTGTWTPDSTTLNTVYIPSNADTAAGSLTFVLVSTNNGQCLEESDTLEVTFDDAPIADAGPDGVVCLNDSAQLDGTISGGGGVVWTTNGSGSFVPDSATVDAVYVPGAGDGVLGTLEMIMTYTNGCGSDSDTAFLQVSPAPVADFSFAQSCEDSTVVFTDESTITTGSIVGWAWDFDDGSVDTLNQNTSHEYTNTGSYNVSLVVTSDLGCTDTVSQSVSVTPPPVADIWVDDSIVDPGQVITFLDTSENAVDWWWDFGDGQGPFNVEDTTYAYSDSGMYQVMLIVYNSAGCADTAYVMIDVEGDDEVLPPVLPEAFTPNGDGANDILYVRGGPFIEFEFRIFNEWGNQIFLSTDQSLGWDGQYKGKLQPGGVYVYSVTGELLDGTEVELNGEVNLVR